MIPSTEQERRDHEAIRQRMVALAKRLLESKHQLQQEIREDMQKPDVQAAIHELKKRNALQSQKRI